MYRCARFYYSGKNEWEFDENNDPVRPGARDLAESIASGLNQHCSGVSIIEQHDYYGWAFATQYEGVTFYHVLNPIDEGCHLTVHLGWYRLRALFGRKPRRRYDAYCDSIKSVLEIIPNVSRVQWDDYFS